MIDCSNISINIDKTEEPCLYFRVNFKATWYKKPLVGGYYVHHNKKIYLQSKIEQNIEQLSVNLLSHETLHHIIAEYVGMNESDIIDGFLKYLNKRDPKEIDSSGILLKTSLLFNIKKRLRLI